MTRLERKLESALGESVAIEGSVGGGSISQVVAATTASGRGVIVKSHPGAPGGLFAAEARGLDWLRVPGGPRIPSVLAVADDDPGFIVLERIETSPGGRDDEIVGRAIATMHRARPTGFGLDHDNFLAAIPQANEATDTWAEFLAERRLRPLTRMANERGELPAPLVRALDRIADRCGELAGPVEPPARLHGDLWSGNLLLDRSGAPVLIDPAVYGGHREIDLAMMRLFGGFSARAFAAYDEAYPLAPGHAERVAFNQLVPLLVHVILFGAGYRERLAEAVRRYAPVR